MGFRSVLIYLQVRDSKLPNTPLIIHRGSKRKQLKNSIAHEVLLSSLTEMDFRNKGKQNL